MFSNLCLVVAGSLDPKFHFQLRKKSWREVPERVGHSTIRQMAAIAWLYMLHPLTEYALSTNDLRYI